MCRKATRKRTGSTQSKKAEQNEQPSTRPPGSSMTVHSLRVCWGNRRGKEEDRTRWRPRWPSSSDKEACFPSYSIVQLSQGLPKNHREANARQPCRAWVLSKFLKYPLLLTLLRQQQPVHCSTFPSSLKGTPVTKPDTDYSFSTSSWKSTERGKGKTFGAYCLASSAEAKRSKTNEVNKHCSSVSCENQNNGPYTAGHWWWENKRVQSACRKSVGII